MTSMKLPQVLLVPQNPLDLREEDLASLIEALRKETSLSVEVGILPQRGYGVTWWEVLLIYIATKGADAVVGHVYNLLLKEITDKVQAWYQRRRAETNNKRPLLLEIRDEEGKVIKALEIEEANRIKDVTEAQKEKPLRPRPEPEPDDQD